MQRVARRFVIAVMALLGTVAGANYAAAQQELSATDGVVQAPAAGQNTATATAAIRNTGMYIVYFTSASTDIASGVELRDGSKGTPAPVKFISVPAYGSLTLDPKGPHLALTGLTRALKPGETVKVTLRTDQGVELGVAAVVK